MIRCARWAAVGALALAVAAPIHAQVDVVFPGWRVYVAATDSTVSTHTTYHVALESAINYALAFNESARVGLVGPVRVDAIAEPIIVTDTVLVAVTDTVLVRDTLWLAPPDTVVVVLQPVGGGG